MSETENSAGADPLPFLGGDDEMEERVTTRTAALRASEQQLAAILEQLPVGVGVLDTHGRFVLSNSIMRDYMSETLASRDPQQRPHWHAVDTAGRTLPPEQWPGARALRGESVKPGIEFTFRDATGRERWLLESAVPFRGANGEIVGAIVGVQDITDRKRTEQALRESERQQRELAQSLEEERARLAAILEHLPVGVWIADQHGRVIGKNQQADRIWAGDAPMSASIDEYEQYGAWYADSGERLSSAEYPMARALRTGAPVEPVELKIRRFDGTYGIVLVSAVPIRDTQGLLTGVAVINVDITDRKRAEAALRKSEERLRAALDASGGAIYDHRVPLDESTFHDERWAQMLGYCSDELPPYAHFLDWLFEQVHPDDLGPLQQAYDDFVEGRTPSYHVEIRLRHKQGHWVWVQGHSHAVERDDSRQVLRIVGVMSDITPFKRVQNALRRLNTTLEERVEERTQQVNTLARRLTMAEQEERRRLSQILHDDLQQLLYAVEMETSMLSARLDGSGQPARARDMEGVRELVNQAIRRTRQLTVDLSPPILHNEGLADALGWLQRQMHELHGLHVTVEAAHSFYLPDEDLRVLLFQIVRELLFNVIKHAGVDCATVRLVEDTEAEAQLVIHVIDAGCGFDVQEVLNREEPAAGFGLFSARERLRLLGGRLEVHSQLGKGTHIEIHAPMR